MIFSSLRCAPGTERSQTPDVTSLLLPQVFPSASEPLNLLSSASSFLLPPAPPHTGPFVPGSSSSSSSQQCTVNLPPLYHKSGSDACFNMDFLDNLSISDFNKTSEPTADVWLVGLLGLEEAGPSAITHLSFSFFKCRFHSGFFCASGGCCFFMVLIR